MDSYFRNKFRNAWSTLRGRKPKWLPKIEELLRTEGPLPPVAIMARLGITKGRLSQIHKQQTGKRIIDILNAQGKLAYALLPSSSNAGLKQSIVNALKILSLYPLETIATSYTTLSEGDYIADLSAAAGVNFVLQQQFSRKVTMILSRYNEEEQLRLLRAFGNVALNGLKYCLTHNVAGMDSRVEKQISGHPEKTFPIIQKDLELFLEYGLKDFVPSFVQQRSHLRLLASALGRILPENSFSALPVAGQTHEPVTLMDRDNELLRGFIDQLGQIKFMLVVALGFPELDGSLQSAIETSPINAEETLQSFDLWMQRLKEGTLDSEHAAFLFDYGARNLKKFINELKDPILNKLTDPASKKTQLRRLHLPSDFSSLRHELSPLEEIEKNLRFTIDLREPWDLLFLYDKHSRGKRPEFYSEILSLVQKRRNEAKLKGFLPIPGKEKTVRKLGMTRRGLLVYYEGQEQPEIIGPNNRAKTA